MGQDEEAPIILGWMLQRCQTDSDCLIQSISFQKRFAETGMSGGVSASHCGAQRRDREIVVADRQGSPAEQKEEFGPSFAIGNERPCAIDQLGHLIAVEQRPHELEFHVPTVRRCGRCGA